MAISRQSGRGASAWILALGAAFCTAAAALADPIATLGGIDATGQYACPSGPGPTCFGTLSFDDPSPGPDPGEVTTADPLLSAALGAWVSFEVVLGPVMNYCVDADPPCTDPNFVPDTTNIRWARFLGSGDDFVIFDDGMNVLLAFDINFIDVSTFVKAANDPVGDGAISLGGFSEESYKVYSQLAISGGTLNQLVGGVGTPAVLAVQLISLTPSLADAKGYFGNNFLTGVGPAPVSASTWDLTIIPEPSTAVLLGSGLLGLIASARRYSRRGK